MGHVVSTGDNAAMKSFFSVLQKNDLDTHRLDAREGLRLAIVTRIETKYNLRRVDTPSSTCHRQTHTGRD